MTFNFGVGSKKSLNCISRSPFVVNDLNFFFSFSDDFHFARKKKHPELAHRSHEFFDPSLAPPFPTREDQNRERVSFLKITFVIKSSIHL